MLRPYLISLLFGVQLAPAASLFAPVWQLGADDGDLLPFSQENWSSNVAPGSANLKDDDYYFAGTYAAPVGTLATDEDVAFVERALTEGDPENRIHFPLNSAQAASTSRLRVTVDLSERGRVGQRNHSGIFGPRCDGDVQRSFVR